MLSEIPSARMRGEAGVVGSVLVVVIAFALFAVIQLTRTTLAAQQIDDRVKVIVNAVGPGSSGVSHLNEVARLDETVRLAGDISTAAKPLSGQAAQVISAAKSIDSTATLIQNNVSSIERTAREINGTVAGDGGIRGNFVTLLPVVRSIRDGVAGINSRADRVVALVMAIQADTTNILTSVGGIEVHANSIDCSPFVNGQACTR